MTAKRLRVVILDDHITPYRRPLFTRLAQEPSLHVVCLFTRKRLPNRQWVIPGPLAFPHQFLPGFILRLNNPPAQSDRRYIVFNPTLLWTLIRHNPDIVVGYAFSVPTWTAFLYTRLAGKHFLSWSTDTPLATQQLGRLQKAVRQVIIPRAAGCMTPSALGRAMFESFGAHPDDITLVTQAADLDVFTPESPIAEMQTRLNLPQSGKVMLYVGYLSERKGVHHLLQALPTIRQAVPNVQLLIVGEGHMQNTLHNHVQQHDLSHCVHFLGYVQQHDLAAIYAAADVFAFPTLGDRFGMVIAEAAASGLPLVTSKFAAASFEFVRQAENGFIIDPEDHHELTEAVIHILSDDDRRQQMGHISRQIAEQKNLDHAASQFAQALHRAAHKTP